MSHDVLLEHNFIGMAINAIDHGERLPEAALLFGPDDFTDRLCAKTWPVIIGMHAPGQATSDVAQALKARGVYSPGDFEKLDAMVGDSSSYFNLDLIAAQLDAQVKERKARERLREASASAADASDVFGAAAELSQAVRDVQQTGKRPGVSLEDATRAFLAGGGQTKAQVHPTQIKMLDQFLGGGLSRGGLHVLGGSPGSGKSSLALQYTLEFALLDSREVHWHSCEMMTHETVGRLTQMLIARRIDPADFLKRKIRFFEAPLQIERIEGYANGSPDLGMVVVDYMQRVIPQGLKKSDNREREVAQISERLKRLAITTKAPVIACAQLSRASMQNSRPPVLSDLRESGAVEQDADTVTIIWRQAEGEQSLSRDGELCLLKNRNGETVSVPVRFHGARYEFTQRFT